MKTITISILVILLVEAVVFKTPKDVRIDVSQKLAVKTTKEFSGPVTLYLVFDRDQELYLYGLR